MKKENNSFWERLKESIPYALVVLIFVVLFGWLFDIIDRSSMDNKNKKLLKVLIIVIPIILYFVWVIYMMSKSQIDYNYDGTLLTF